MTTEERNPYEAPNRSENEEPGEGIWRSDNLLVISHSTEIPNDWCIKSNEPTSSVGWMIFGPKLFATGNPAIAFGLSDRLAFRRVWRQRLAGLGFMLCMAICISSLLYLWRVVSMPPPIEPATADLDLLVWRIITALSAFVVGMLCNLVSMIVVLVNYFQLSVNRRTKTHFFIKGAHPDFLARFPEWPRS